MNKKISKQLSIVLLLIIMVSSLFLTSSVNATSITLNEERIITKEMVTEEEQISLEEEKIMEYDSETGITREIDMNTLRNTLALKNRGRTDRIEAYNPLADTNSTIFASARAVYNPVSELTSLPYRATCRIKADVYGETLVASGYVAGPKILVTAAHCVMNEKDNDAYFADWVAYPGYNYGNSYKGVSSGWSRVYYSSNWKATHSAVYDWCICILNSNIGDTTGWCGTQSYGTSAEMNGLSVKLLGYPLGIGGGQRQYYTAGTISNTRDLYFDSSATSIDGFSGGPVIRTSDNYVVGINRGHYPVNPEIEFGVRITQNMINIILENF